MIGIEITISHYQLVLQQHKRGAADVTGVATKAVHDGSDKTGLAGTQITIECDDRAGPDPVPKCLSQTPCVFFGISRKCPGSHG